MLLMQRKPGQYPVDALQAVRSNPSKHEMRETQNGSSCLTGARTVARQRNSPLPVLRRIVHIIATELGIEKKGMGDVQYDEIEKVVRAVMDNGGEKECTKT